MRVAERSYTRYLSQMLAGDATGSAIPQVDTLGAPTQYTQRGPTRTLLTTAISQRGEMDAVEYAKMLNVRL